MPLINPFSKHSGEFTLKTTKKTFLWTLTLVLMMVTALPTTVNAQDASVAQDVLETYAEIAYTSYQDSLIMGEALQVAIEAFLAEPTEETHQTAKEAWLAAQEPYGQTEVYRFYGGPIDGEDGPEGLMNAWPLDEAYVDYVEGDPDAGIINNPDDFPEITEKLLLDLNEQGAEENIATGYHAIEFLLWGQDLSAETNGQRPYTDYVDAPNAERRATYLQVITDRLVFDLQSLVDAWAPDVDDNYRAEFVASDPNQALTNILTGMGVLSKSELSGERMFTAYDNQDQEDEHSCFSDNTHRDIITNLQGIANVYWGTYTRIDGTVVEGTGVSALLAEVSPELDAEINSTLEAAIEATNAIYVPFDQAIVLPDERDQVLDSVFLLQDLGDLIASAASELGLTINTALPE
jgi:putative iron-regulated protein